ncbi:hypothetical protein BLGI_726 [Brevibacillus laterosporus GI-9]|nr:hypothetical protein BLGI_726 [Brevibacillus laterosporus GI-9]
MPMLFHYLKFDSLGHEPFRHKLYRLHPVEVEHNYRRLKRTGF